MPESCTGPMSFEECMRRTWPGISDKPAFCAEMARGDLNKSFHERVIKLDDERRLATVIVSTVTDAQGNPIIDAQGDIIPIDVLEDAFIDAFSAGGINKGEEMHERMGLADVVQHFTLSRKERVALGFGDGPEMGIAKLRVHDDALWQKIKAGKLPEMSFTGYAVREPVGVSA